MGRILVAEDDADVRQMLVQILQYGGHEVEAVSTGGEALARVRDFAPDLFITDMLMPGGGGEELLHTLQQEADVEPEQILILTGLGQDDWRVQAARNKGIGVEQKPIRAKPFLERIGELLDKRT